MIPAYALLLLRVMSSAEINARQHDSRGADLRLEKEGREVGKKIMVRRYAHVAYLTAGELAKRFEPIFPSQDRRSPAPPPFSSAHFTPSRANYCVDQVLNFT